MVFWNPCLLTDKELAGKEKQVAHRILQRKRQKHVYCILLPQNPANLFEIMHVNELFFPYYQNKNLYLIGLAYSREHAINLVCNIIASAYREEEEPDIRSKFADCVCWKEMP